MRAKTIDECQLRAGMLLATLQGEGYAPADVTTLALLLAAYVIDKQSSDKRAAVEHAKTFLTTWVFPEDN